MNKIKSKEFNDYKINPSNKSCTYCNYKKICGNDRFRKVENVIINLTLNHQKIEINMEPFLEPILRTRLEREFSYEVNNKKYAIEGYKKKYNRDWDGIIRIFNYNSLPLGLLEDLKILLKSYKKFMEGEGKRVLIKYNDLRTFPNISADLELNQLKNIQLRDYQNKAVRKMIDDEIFFADICTSAGKTVIASELIRKLNYKTLFVVDSKDLMKQSKIDIEKFLDEECGLITEGEQNWKKINFANIQTVRGFIEKYDNKFMKNLHECNLVIVDEAHGVKSKSYQILMNNIKARYRVGLTGTAYCEGNESLKLYSVFGKPKMRIKTRDLINEGFLNDIKVYFVNYKLKKKRYSNYNEAYEETLTSEERLSTIPLILKKHKNDFSLIMVNKIKHMDLIGEILQEENIKYEIVKGEINSEKRYEIIEKMRKKELHVIIGTDKIVQKGLNIKSLNVLINYTGNKSSIITEQSKGRLNRKDETNPDKISYYYDYLDIDRFLIEHTKNRMKTFIDGEFEIQELNIDEIYKVKENV